MARARYPYGFRVSTFRLEQPEAKKQDSGPETEPLLPLDTQSAKSVVLRAVQELHAQKLVVRDRKQHTIVDVIDATAEGFILLKVEGGASGNEFTVKDEHGEALGAVRERDALVWPGRVLIAFASNDAREGFMVHETYAGKTHSSVTRDRLASCLHSRHGVALHTEHDVADNIAWDRVLQDEKARLEELEFTAAAPDGVVLGEGTRPTRMSVAYRFDRTPVHSFLGLGSRTSVADLVDHVGVLPEAAAFEDGEAVAEISTAHGPRRLQLGRKPYPFTRVIESPTQVGDVEFIREVSPDLVDLAARLHMALPNPFLPTRSLDQTP